MYVHVYQDEDQDEAEHCPSLTPPPPCEMTWDEYLDVPSDEYVPYFNQLMIVV